ncbi:methyltransferase domain-containing protein [Streptomyces longispororuber]|uniref:class I SAM-dependent methyltransferase n=1 Tax=Streptomyces longispororuber TaxID=68230 RepID=UPI0033D305AD
MHADAVEYLSCTPTVFDAVYSVWGAVWFTDPDRLLPLIARRLAPGGVLAFAHLGLPGGRQLLIEAAAAVHAAALA